MEETYYLPKESPTFVNFPVLRDEKTNIELITAYALRAYSALSDYNEALFDRVDINTDELEQYIILCRQICNSLGTADNIPFDILLELRSVLTSLYQLRQLYNDLGSVVIGKPSEVAEDEGI